MLLLTASLLFTLGALEGAARYWLLSLAGEFRIVCLGGWTTYTGRVDQLEYSFPVQLEKQLHERRDPQVRVINAGAEGWSSWESLINLETRVLDLEPDLIVDYDGINDLHARIVWPPAAYRGDNSGRRAPNVAGVVMPGLLEYSTLARIVLVRSGRLEPHADLSRTIDQPAPIWQGAEFWRQWRQGTYPEGLFATTSLEQMLQSNPPVYFERNLESLVVLARSYGAETMLATFAQAHGYARHPTSSPDYARGIDEMNDVVRRVAGATGAHLFDFAAVMPRGENYFADGEHVNARGAERKAELFADAILGQNLVPAASTAAAP